MPCCTDVMRMHDAFFSLPEAGKYILPGNGDSDFVHLLFLSQV